MAVLTVTPTKDATRLPAANIGNATSVTVAVARDSGGKGAVESDGMFQFNVSSIPAAAVISAATFTWYLASVSSWETTEAWTGAEITSSWAETDGSANPTIGTTYSFGAINLDSATIDSAHSTAVSTTLVGGWVTGSIANNGIYVNWSTGVDAGDFITIHSREATNSALRPILQVTYNTAPGAPGAFTVPATSGDYNNSISADWGDATDPDADSLTYELQYAPAPYSSWTTIGSLTAGSSRTVDTSAWSPGSYKMRTRANDGLVYGPYTESGIFTITHNVAPGVPTNVGRQTPYTDTTPVLTADLNDNNTGQSVKARFELYQSDGTTLIATIDSGFVTAPATATAEYTTALPVGTYKVRAKGIDDLAAESAYSALTTIYVTQEASEDLILKWNVRALAIEDLILIWNVIRAGEKDLALIWNTKLEVSEDLVLKWNTKTPWRTVDLDDDATTWTEVGNP